MAALAAQTDHAPAKFSSVIWPTFAGRVTHTNQDNKLQRLYWHKLYYLTYSDTYAITARPLRRRLHASGVEARVERFGNRDLRQILNFLQHLYTLRSYKELTDYLTTALPSLTKGEINSYHDLRSSFRWPAVNSDALHVPHNPERHYVTPIEIANSHPSSYQLKQPRLTPSIAPPQHIPPRRFRHPQLHREFYESCQISYITGIPIQARPRTPLVHHQSGGALSDKTRRTLNSIRPHIVYAIRNALAITIAQNRIGLFQHALESSQRTFVAVTETGQFEWATPSAMGTLQRYGLHPSVAYNLFPAPLRAWLIKQQKQLRTSREVGSPISPLAISGNRRRLLIRLIKTGDQDFLFLEEQRHGIEANQFDSLGLTKRETEVFRWLAEGKTNSEIGTILGISCRTVQTHLQRIYRHLAVDNRHAAMRIALGPL